MVQEWIAGGTLRLTYKGGVKQDIGRHVFLHTPGLPMSARTWSSDSGFCCTSRRSWLNCGWERNPSSVRMAPGAAPGEDVAEGAGAALRGGGI